ncbi:fibronectin type III-like domain-contianing protein [Streptomyces sp. NBC_01296]|nr:fibronectin type III-like domain-contianing protein [Streptomyces sp. NBC_01296]
MPDPLDYDVIKACWTYQYHEAAPLYPFGHGLSFTDFAYSGLGMSRPSIGQDGSVDVTVTLANTGPREGSEVVQLYIRALDARYEAPRRRLADFRKVRLEPGECRELSSRSRPTGSPTGPPRPAPSPSTPAGTRSPPAAPPRTRSAPHGSR